MTTLSELLKRFSISISHHRAFPNTVSNLHYIVNKAESEPDFADKIAYNGNTTDLISAFKWTAPALLPICFVISSALWQLREAVFMNPYHTRYEDNKMGVTPPITLMPPYVNNTPTDLFNAK